MRSKKFTEEEVLDKAITAFWGRGLTATSADDLMKAMGIGQGSLYHTYKNGKREVFEKAIRQFHRKGITAFRKSFLDSKTPLDVIREFFLGIAKGDLDEHLRGCLISNTVVEMSFIDKDLEKEAVSILKELEHLFLEIIEKAKSNGQLRNETAPSVLARQLITLWSGLNVTRRLYPDNKMLKELISKELEILE